MLWNRIIGGFLILKVYLPFLIVAVAITGTLVLVDRLSVAVSRHYDAISREATLARAQILIVETEARRLVEEVRRIQDEGTKFARNVKNLIKPLKGALHGLSQAMGLVARTVQNVINGVINAWNKLPLLPDLPRVRIKNYFVIPAFDIELPNVNLTVSDEAYAAVRTVAESSANMANEARTTLKTLTDLVRFWLRLMLFILLLLVVWSVLAIIGHLARCRLRLAVGWRMIRGEAIENPLSLL